jgi:glycosyltransferase involved in cell wall biosynthesis
LPHRLVVCGRFASSDSLGAGYRRQVEAIFVQAGLGGRLVLIENVSVAQLRALYADAALYVQSSAAETFGRTVIEAMACGTPVLAARAAATPEILADAGRYYEAASAEECAGGILAILQNDGLRQDLIARGLSRAQDFSYDDEVGKLIALLHRV